MFSVSAPFVTVSSRITFATGKEWEAGSTPSVSSSLRVSMYESMLCKSFSEAERSSSLRCILPSFSRYSTRLLSIVIRSLSFDSISMSVIFRAQGDEALCEPRAAAAPKRYWAHREEDPERLNSSGKL